MARPARWQIVRTDAGHHLRLVGANGETVATTEVYTTRTTALLALSIIELAGVDGFVDVDERTSEEEHGSSTEPARSGQAHGPDEPRVEGP